MSPPHCEIPGESGHFHRDVDDATSTDLGEFCEPQCVFVEIAAASGKAPPVKQQASVRLFFQR
jgi:hypothetical protein